MAFPQVPNKDTTKDPNNMANVTKSNKAVILVVYCSLLLDNMLLTVVVPIIPDYLRDLAKGLEATAGDASERVYNTNETSTWKMTIRSNASNNMPAWVDDENGRLGLLFSSKAFVQLIANSFVGMLTNRVGYSICLFFGNMNLLICALVFAYGESYEVLFLARSLQGVSSACLAISGMGMLADRYPEDSTRSHVMGIAMGGIAMGVLVGYPMGSVLYDFAGKPVPFLVISVLVVINGALQCGIIRPSRKTEHLLVGTPTCTILKDHYILAAAGSIWVSTLAMAVLEICLPIWLLENVQPEKWQLGMVFIPDSIGYLLGTNCFGFVALRLGRWLVAMSSLMLVGVSCILIPFAKAVVHLIIPHFMLGLGIGAADSALMPFLAHIVDTRYSTGYGTVYAIAQAAVSLAYSLGPLMGGELVKYTGFPTLMRIVAGMNLAYSPLCLTLRKVLPSPEEKQAIALDLASSNTYKTESRARGDVLAYRRFTNDDSDID